MEKAVSRGRWYKVVEDAAAITEDMPASVEAGERSIGVFRIRGELYAIEDICPHAFARLSEGCVEG